jgi:hypothetical protein
MKRLFGSVLAWSGWAFIVACSSASNPSNVCSMTPLSQSNCPSTYSAALSQCKSDNSAVHSYGDQAGACGGVLLLSASGPFGGHECSYDSTTKALVGALDEEGDVEGPGGCLGSSSGASIPKCNFTNLDCSPPDGGTPGELPDGATDAGRG